jgi:hypothetical protein
MSFLACAAALGLPWIGALAPAPGLQNDDLEPLPPERVERELRGLAERHGAATTLELGRTRQGRPLLALQLNAAEDGKPGLLLVAGIDAEHRTGPGFVLDHARRLLAAEETPALLESFTVYCIPAANPDGLALAFGDTTFEPVTQGRGVDNDRDARQGEDGGSDLDGDGVIGWMRVPDPAGEWMPDPHDPRAQIEPDPLLGQSPTFRLEPEGLDGDGDERVGEDPAHDTRFNRNFPANWEELAPDAGRFPTDEPGVRHLCDFVVAHPELTVAVVLGAQDNLVETPSAAGSGGRVPAAGVMGDDRDWLARWGERWREVAPGGARDSADAAGSFQAWLYEHRGLWTLNVKPWQLPEGAPPEEESEAEAEPAEPAPEEPAEAQEALAEADSEAASEASEELPGKPSSLARQLEWIDAMGDAEAWRFRPWRPFDHPTLGTVELGGLAPFAAVEPPASERRALADAQFALLEGLAADPPRLAIPEATATVLAPGLVRVEAVVTNRGGLPLLSASARRARTQRPARLDLILPADGELLGGAAMELIPDLDPSGARAEFTWLVRTDRPQELSLELTSTHAGNVSRTPEVTQ